MCIVNVTKVGQKHELKKQIYKKSNKRLQNLVFCYTFVFYQKNI